MFRSLKETSPIVGRHRNLIQALFGNKCDNFDAQQGYDSDESVEWAWEDVVGSDFVYLMNDNRDVKFHRKFSSGTAVVRGTQPMSNDQYYWEVKMMSPVYGTDMMVGVGTSDADMSQVHEKFLSLLGLDSQTWGLSYTGMFHHNGESHDYASRFGQGSVIGVHLDMWNGTLSFYKNKKHLGIASRGLKGKTLYAMASSTAACSGMRIIRSCSFPSSLQFLCCARIRELISDDKDVLKAIKFPPGLHLFLQNNLSWLLDPRYSEYVVHQYIPSPRRRGHWAFGLDPASESLLGDFLFGDDDIDNLNTADSEEEARVTIRSAPSVNPFQPICDCKRFQRPRHPLGQGSKSTRRNVREKETSEQPSTAEHKTSVQEEQVTSVESSEFTDNHDRSIESETKRRRCSYNYAMGLSDPDSD